MCKNKPQCEIFVKSFSTAFFYIFKMCLYLQTIFIKLRYANIIIKKVFCTQECIY